MRSTAVATPPANGTALTTAPWLRRPPLAPECCSGVCATAALVAMVDAALGASGGRS